MSSKRSDEASTKRDRHRKRKSRTEVSPVSSDSEDATAGKGEEVVSKTRHSKKEKSSKEGKTKKRKHAKANGDDATTTSNNAKADDRSNAMVSAAAAAAAAAVRATTDAEAEEAFTGFYLGQLTSEFAEDLDRLRSANDFRDNSVSLLVEALKQGRSCFDKEDRLAIGRAELVATRAAEAGQLTT